MDEHTPEVAPPLCGGRYRLREVLGEGGMAVVYRAWDSRLEVERAVKLLLPEMAARPRIRDRFHAEARTMARLSHPHIVSVHDVDADGERVYIVMELIEGGTLWDRVVQLGPMPPRLAVDAVLPALSALALAHERGVVHRDVKPQNVMITPDGVPKLTDFGIARIETDGVRTRTAAVMGTWTYMPPEQRSSARDTDARSDLYAVGAMLYALVQGHDPPDLFAADLDATLLEGVPPALAAVIRGATRYRRDDRFPDAAAMADALAGCRDALPELSAEAAASWPAPGSVAITTGGARRSGSSDPTSERPPDPAATIPPPLEPVAAASPALLEGAEGGQAALSLVAPVVVPTRPAAGPMPPPPMPREAAAAARPQTGPTSIPPADGTFYDELDDELAPTRSRLPLVLGLLSAGLVVVALFIGLPGDQPAAPLESDPATPALVEPSADDPQAPVDARVDDADGDAVDQAAAGASASTTRSAPAPTPRPEPVTTQAAPATAAPATAAPATAAPSTAAPSTTTGAPQDGGSPDDSAIEAAAIETAAIEAAAIEAAAASTTAASSAAAPPVEADQPPSVEPAGSTSHDAAPAEPAGSGAVAIAGNVDKVSLIDKTTGDSWGPGTVPAGDYWVHARFPGQDEARRVGQVRVMPDWEVVVRCHTGRKTCQ